MDYHLERKIVLCEELDQTSLYCWSLQEFDKNGQKKGSDQIPWLWSLYFTATQIRCLYSLDIDRESTDQNERIIAKLQPGVCNGGKWEHDVSYSMFGTSRETKDFELSISKIKDNRDIEYSKKCKAWGYPRYTTELNFRNETMDDMVGIELYLSDQEFNKLFDLIKHEKVAELIIRINRVSGFYSNWTPGIRTYDIKILTDDSEVQKILMKDDSKIDPPRLGEIGEFGLTIIQHHRLSSKHELETDEDNLFEKPQVNKGDIIEEQENKDLNIGNNSLILSQLARNEEVIRKLSFPIWFICIILLVKYLF